MAGASGSFRIPPGTVLGERYRLDDRLGQGAMGVVFRATDLQTGRHLAIKLLTAEISPTRLERFRREGELAARVDKHGGVVRIHELGDHGGLPFLVMEWVDGPSLEDVLTERRTLPPAEAMRVVADLARTLAAVHEAGVVHRDLKPANVLLPRAGGPPKLADFGTARGEDLERLTRTGAVVGTPATMAPEQLMRSNAVDARADVYSLGATLYLCLCGVPPFEAQSLQELHAYLTSRVPAAPPSSHTPAVTPGLDAICLKALEKDPARRYATALELAEDLDRLSRGEAAVAAKRRSSVFGLSRRVSGRTLHLARATLGGTLLFVGALLALWLTVLGPRAQAKATLAEFREWPALDAYALGLGPTPDARELERRLRWLSERQGTVLEREAAPVEARYAAALRALGARAGLDAPPSTTPSPEDRLLDALLRAEAGDARSALRTLQRAFSRIQPPSETARVRPHLWGLQLAQLPGRASAEAFAAYRERVANQGLPGEFERALTYREAAIRGWLSELLADLEAGTEFQAELVALREHARGLGDPALTAMTLDAVERAAPKLEQEASELRRRGDVAGLLLFLGNLLQCVGHGTQGRPPLGPAARGLLDRVLGAELDAWSTLATGDARSRQAERCLQVETLCFYLDPTRAPDPRLEPIYLDLVAAQARGLVEDYGIFINGVRLTRARKSTYTAEVYSRMIPEAAIARRLELHPRCPVARLLTTLARHRPTSQPPEIAGLKRSIEELEAVLAEESVEFTAPYLAEARITLSQFRRKLWTEQGKPVSGRPLVRAALRDCEQAIELNPKIDIRWWYCHEATECMNLLDGAPGPIHALWRQAEERILTRIDDRQAAGQELELFDRLGAAKAYRFGSEVLWRAGFFPEAAAMAQRGLDAKLGEDLFLLSVIARFYRHTGRAAEARALLAPFHAEGIEENPVLAIEIIELLVAEGKLDEAQAVVEQSMRRHPKALGLPLQAKRIAELRTRRDR